MIGRAWPASHFALDLRASVGVGFFSTGWESRPAESSVGPSGVSTVPFGFHASLTPRIGLRPGKRSLHFIAPLGLDAHPGRYDGDLRYAVYLNIGAGLGFMRPVGMHGFFGFDVAALGGMNMGETFGRNLALYPRWRAGVDVAFFVGLRL